MSTNERYLERRAELTRARFDAQDRFNLDTTTFTIVTSADEKHGHRCMSCKTDFHRGQVANLVFSRNRYEARCIPCTERAIAPLLDEFYDPPRNQ